jgi:predicted membrane protein
MMPAGKMGMPTDTRLNVTPQLIMGVFMIVFGVLLTLDRMELVDAGRTLRFWPVVFIALGGWIVLERGHGGRSFSGYALMIVGSLLLLNSLGIARVRFWELFWPMIIVLVGARLIMHSPGQRWARHGLPIAFGRSTDPAPGRIAGDGIVSMASFLGSDQRTHNEALFRGGEITSVLSGTQLDLRQATIEPGTDTVINVFILLGGHELWVPQGWTLVVEVTPILGGIEDKRLPSIRSTAPEGGSIGVPPRVVLRGIVLLGGLTIKN